MRKLTHTERNILDTLGRPERAAPGESVVWVSVEEQMLRLVRDDDVIAEYPCSTAAAGTGCAKDSYQTPTGWHRIARKIGDDAALGQVFRGRERQDRVWRPGDGLDEDLVLTRILWLTGNEPGRNVGGDVDTFERYIYIHGTNHEDRVGTPCSHGCVRLRNADVVDLYDRLEESVCVIVA